MSAREERPKMLLDGARADVEFFGDLLITAPFDEEVDDPLVAGSDLDAGNSRMEHFLVERRQDASLSTRNRSLMRNCLQI